MGKIFFIGSGKGGFLIAKMNCSTVLDGQQWPEPLCLETTETILRVPRLDLNRGFWEPSYDHETRKIKAVQCDQIKIAKFL